MHFKWYKDESGNCAFLTYLFYISNSSGNAFYLCSKTVINNSL